MHLCVVFAIIIRSAVWFALQVIPSPLLILIITIILGIIINNKSSGIVVSNSENPNAGFGASLLSSLRHLKRI